MLNEAQRQYLLSLARETIAAHLKGKPAALDATSLDEDLQRPAGAFVTLTDHSDELRGCIGSIEAREPLYQAVMSSAISAATRDPRFRPVSPDELSLLNLEISVMGPILPVSGPEEIEIGRDGLIISRGRFTGLLLPQVAADYGWNREEFLSHTCVKAGLPPDGWRDGSCRIQHFSAEVFGEKLMHLQ
ncbi:MAG: AmmeMemoRadiSam system protein A [Thermoanaerobaculia bacterium]